VPIKFYRILKLIFRSTSGCSWERQQSGSEMVEDPKHVLPQNGLAASGTRRLIGSFRFCSLDSQGKKAAAAAGRPREDNLGMDLSRIQLA